MSRWIAPVAALLLGALVTGCGGGGAGAGGSGGGSSAIDPASMLVTTSTPSIGSDGRTSATISAIVKDASNRTLTNQQVEFATTDAGSRLQVISARTDASGVASALLSIADPANRTIAVSARTGALLSSVQVAVAGTQLALNGPTDLVAGAANDFTVSLRDSSGAVIAARLISISSSAGNTLSSASVTTDSAGQARFQVTAVKAGADTLSVSALGTSATSAIQVSTTQLSFSAPTAALEVPVNLAQDVSVRYLIGGVPQVGQAVQFATTRGVLSAASAITDGSGRASVTVTSSTAGVATITALAGTVNSAQRIEFVSRVSSKITLQPSPAIVGVNLSPTGLNASKMIAVVRDAADNPVKGALVSFSAISDPSNGRIEPATATTDASGVATVAFFPGANSTGNSQIRMQATVVGTAVNAQTELTASRQELVVRIGTGNTIAVPNATTYAMPWAAGVTDGSGNPVAGATVQASLVGVRFLKGAYVWNGVAWAPAGENSTLRPFPCLSEDSNQNARLDDGEDRNGNKQLDSVGTASVSASGVTDSTGFASLNVSYPKEFANWTEVRLRVTMTTLAGSEGRSDRVFVLPVLAADLTDEVAPPPGLVSPFGRIGDCTSVD